MRYGHNAMAPIDATSLSRANSSQTVRLLWTVARSVTTPADQHKTQVNRFFFFLLDHTNKIHFSQACLHGKKYRIGKLYLLLRASERSERSEHTVVLSSRFLSIYIYIVTKNLRKIRATTFTERLRKITREGERL